MNLRSKIILLFFPACFFSCGPEKKSEENSIEPTTQKTETSRPRIVPPEFSSDSAFRYVKTQMDLGPRVPGTQAHQKCLAWFEAYFQDQGATVKIMGDNAQTFDGKKWRIDNLIASFDPSNEERILLAAHYDSRPFAEKDSLPENRLKPTPGANDGASGVGVLMEIARQLKIKKPKLGIDIVLFDLEDYGDMNGEQETWCLGSQSWSSNPHKPAYKARYGILLDMVGAQGAVFPKEKFSTFYASHIVNTVWNAARNSGYGQYFSDAEAGEITDDHYYINENAHIPCIDIIHYSPAGYGEFFKYHHTTKDDLNSIDKNTLKAVGQTILEVIYNEN